MNINRKITAALLALGLVSAAGVASASSTYTDTANASGYGANTVFNVVYVTGSTAFRGSLEAACASGAGPSAGGVFDAAPVKTVPGATSNQEQYWGKINGVPYIIDIDTTGSEAGIAALLNHTITYPTTGDSVAGAPATATLPGTPKPTGFLDPANGTADLGAVAPDLAFADTSSAVSLTPNASTLTDYGIVAIIPFELVKGKNTGGSASYGALTNITIAQFTYFLAAGKENDSFFTGNASDSQNVYLFGRNEGSGTRVNTTLVAGDVSPSAFNQYADQNASYSGGVLTAGAVAAYTGLPKTLGTGFEGYDSGSGVTAALSDDSGAAGFISVGYLGLSDAANAIKAGGEIVEFDGNIENDENVINGEYSFWGHEHLYGAPGQSSTSPGGVVGNLLNGGVVNDSIYTSWTPTTGALEETFQNPPSGGNENPPTAQSLAVDPAIMGCDKPSDAGYPSQ